MQIREVELTEIAGVLSLIDEYDRPLSPQPSDEQASGIYDAIVQGGGCIIGAFIDTKMVGTCTVNISANLSWSGRPFAIVENVIVSKTYRNKGIGKAILRFAVAFAQQAGCYKVALMTGSKDPATHRFYESAGFSGNKTGYQIRFNA